jgi:D-3-phosphoglycerate dehydrogenase
MKKHNVLITARSFGKEVPESMERRIKQGFRILEWREGSGLEVSELIRKVGQADAWIVGSYPIQAALLENAPRLQIIAKHGVGIDNIDVPAATKKGILVAIAPGSNDQAVADMTMALLLSLVRSIPQANASVNSGRWERFKGFGLTGKTIGIIGLGHIGLNVAKRVKGFDMEILGCDPSWPEERALEIGIARVDFETLIGKSDVISLHVPLTPETEGLVGEHQIALMKKGVWIVNTSRGKIIDEKAIYQALVSGRVAGYATDVFETEPPEGNLLLDLANVVATPHIGSYTNDALRMLGDSVVDTILKVFHGEKSECIINPEAYQFRKR